MSRGFAIRYAVGLGMPVLAAAAQWLVWRYIPPSPHLLFYPAVFAAARLGGVGPGFVASLTSAGLIAWAFLSPSGSVLFSAPEDALDLTIFLSVSIVMSIVIGHTVRQLRAALAREQEAALEAKRAREATAATWEIVAHDLRTPLSAIALGTANLGDASSETVGVIQRASETAARLIRDAVDAMAVANGELKVVLAPSDLLPPLQRVVDVASPLASKAGVTIELDAPASTRVLADPSRLLQVVLNLVVNAIRFTPRGGRVSVSASEDGGSVTVAVRDTGPGIPPEMQTAIFSKYWTSGSGSGLGLWIAKTLVEAHGGVLRLVSREGDGAEFSFALPRVGAEAVSRPP